MKIEYYHASKFGNGARIAEEFKRIMAGKGITVNLHHVKETSPREIPQADIYVFSSPGRMGKPIKDMRRFLKKLQITSGAYFAILVTEMNPEADIPINIILANEELGKCQRVTPIMNEMIQKKGLIKILEGKIYVTGIKGPLENGWLGKVEQFANLLMNSTDMFQLADRITQENIYEEVVTHD